MPGAELILVSKQVVTTSVAIIARLDSLLT